MPTLHFTLADWERVEHDTLAWWNGELRRPLVYLAVPDMPPEERPCAYLSNYPLDQPVDAVIDQNEPYLASIRYYADAFPTWWVNFGPGIVAGFLGAKVNSVRDPSETVWFSPPADLKIQDFNPRYDPQNIWWQRVQALTAAIAGRFGRMLAVAHTDLGGNLDVLASFITTERLLLDLIDQPEAVEQAARQITNLWLRFYAEQEALIRPVCGGTSCWTPIWSPGKTYMLQSDFSYMISPAMFERFVLPDLVACCNFLDQPFYHLDGKGEIPHLDLLLSIPKLKGIQWVPGDGQPPPDCWLPLLDRIRRGGKLCQVTVTPQGALRIVRELGGKGFLLWIQDYGPEFQEPEQVHSFLHTLAKEDISLQKIYF